MNSEIYVLVAGAVVAGVSAVVKAWFESRDARKIADRQLDLAIKRTQFVKEWIEVSRTVGEKAKDTTNAELVLDEAYKDAENAMKLETDSRDTIGQLILRQLQDLLMVERRKNPWSYVASGVFILLSISVAFDVVSPDGGSLLVEAAILLVLTLVLRFIAGLIVRALEARGDKYAKAGDQISYLLMFRSRKNPLSYIVSAGFLIVLAGTLFLVVAIASESTDDGDASCIGYELPNYDEREFTDKDGKPLTASSCEPQGESDSRGVFYVATAQAEQNGSGPTTPIPVCSYDEATGLFKEQAGCIADWYYVDTYSDMPMSAYVANGLLISLAVRLLAGLLVRGLEWISTRRSDEETATDEGPAIEVTIDNDPLDIGNPS